MKVNLEVLYPGLGKGNLNLQVQQILTGCDRLPLRDLKLSMELSSSHGHSHKSVRNIVQNNQNRDKRMRQDAPSPLISC